MIQLGQSGATVVKATLLACLFAIGGLSAASAQVSVGVGVEFGGPVYYGPPPVYLYEQPPPYGYVPAPPALVYAPPEVPAAVPPDVVFDNLEEDGYSELGPMAFRDGVYKLSAVNPDGELVALEVSVLTGEVEIERIIGSRQAAAPLVPRRRAPAPAPAPALPPPPENGRDPLVIY
jgi:hypothetical protein